MELHIYSALESHLWHCLLLKFWILDIYFFPRVSRNRKNSGKWMAHGTWHMKSGAKQPWMLFFDIQKKREKYVHEQLYVDPSYSVICIQWCSPFLFSLFLDISSVLKVRNSWISFEKREQISILFLFSSIARHVCECVNVWTKYLWCVFFISLGYRYECT